MDKDKFISELWKMQHDVSERLVIIKEQKQTANCAANVFRADEDIVKLSVLLESIQRSRNLVETYKEDRELNKILYKNVKAQFAKTMSGRETEVKDEKQTNRPEQSSICPAGAAI